MIGSATGSFIAALLNNPVLHIVVLVIVIQFIQFRLRSQYFLRKGEHILTEKHKSNNRMPLLVIALVGLVVMVSEGIHILH